MYAFRAIGRKKVLLCPTYGAATSNLALRFRMD